MDAPKIAWRAAAHTFGWGGQQIANTWTAEFGQGYLVLHASPTGNLTMCWIPHSESGLEPHRLVFDEDQS